MFICEIRSLIVCAKGGGGGGSGVVDYPDYMKTIHGSWLDNGGLDTITSSITDAMNAALGNSPWTGETAYDPSTAISAYETALSDFDTLIGAVNETTSWASMFTQATTSITVADSDSVADIAVADIGAVSVSGATYITDAELDDAVTAYGDILDDNIDSNVYPRFEAGMRDINAVVSSAFPIGRAIIETARNHDLAKFSSDIRLQAALKNADINLSVAAKDADLALAVASTNQANEFRVDTTNLEKDLKLSLANLQKDTQVAQLRLSAADAMLRLMTHRLSLEESYARTMVEANRIKIVAEKEESDKNLEIGESDALWDLEAFQYGANLLAGIGGGTSTAGKKPSVLSSALGGAMSGAAAGGMLGSAVGGSVMGMGAGPFGMIAGGVLGAASAFL